jgi:hypothetical protein
MPADAQRGKVPSMHQGHLLQGELDGVPGWSWRPLSPDDLALAWPLACLTGAAPDLPAWLALARGWLAGASQESGGLGALANPGGVLMALARHRLHTRAGIRVFSVPWLRALELTAAPRCLEALVLALAQLSRRTGCAMLELVAEEATQDRLAALADRLRLARRGGCWRREFGPGAEIVPLPRPPGAHARTPLTG